LHENIFGVNCCKKGKNEIIEKYIRSIVLGFMPTTVTAGRRATRARGIRMKIE